MLRRARSLPSALALGLPLAALLLAGATVPVAAAPRFELVEPAAGAELVAGGRAELAWRLEDEAGLSSDFVEWEVFLSLDGGASYPYRITPHLGRDVQRFSWQVPPVASGDVRFLLRYGDERQEVGVELAGRWQIAARPTLALPAGYLELPSFTAGERARESDQGVVSWVEGNRRGEGLRQRTAREDTLSGGNPRLIAVLEHEAAAEDQPDPPSGGRALAHQSTCEPGSSSAPSGGSPRLAGGPNISILLQTSRRNE